MATFRRYEGRVVSCKLGINNTGSSIDVADAVKEVVWNEVMRTEPQTAANDKLAKGIWQGHKHVEGELRAISEIDEALYVNESGQMYINPGGDHDVMRCFILELQRAGITTTSLFVFADPVMTQSGVASTVTWGGVNDGGITDFEPSYFRYPFKAIFVMHSGVHAKN